MKLLFASFRNFPMGFVFPQTWRAANDYHDDQAVFHSSKGYVVFTTSRKIWPDRL